MEHHTENEQAVLDVIARECTAFWMRDEASFRDCHAPGSDTLRWGYWHGGGLFARRGADSIVPASIAHMRRLERAFPEIPRARIANVVVHVLGDMAWVRLDRLVPHIPDMRHGHGPNGTMQLLFILERIDGQWLIVVTTILDAHLGDEVAVRIDATGTVVWRSRRAELRLADDPDFVLRYGRLRLRQRRLDLQLQSAIRWAAGLSGPLMPTRGAVPLVVERSVGATRISWVIAEDAGHALVILDDSRPIAERISHAAQVFGLSPVQTRVALAISEGHTLGAFARQAGTTQNTARTHLRRVFEKTGVSSQPALVAVLLSLTPPR